MLRLDNTPAVAPSTASGTVSDVILLLGETSSTSAMSRRCCCSCVASVRTVSSVVRLPTSTRSVRTWCPVSTAPDSCTSSIGRHGPIEGNRGPKSQPHEKVALRRNVASGSVGDITPTSSPSSAGSSGAIAARASPSRCSRLVAAAGAARPGAAAGSRSATPPGLGPTGQVEGRGTKHVLAVT